MKHLILNNYHEIDMDDRIKKILRTRFQENREYWHMFQESYWPENRNETMKRFFSLQTGDALVTQHTFTDWQQLEIMSEILEQLTKKGIRISFYIVHPALVEEIQEFLDHHESSIVPNTPWYNESGKRRERFKMKMDQKVLAAIKNHDIVEIYASGLLDDRVLKVDDFKITNHAG